MGVKRTPGLDQRNTPIWGVFAWRLRFISHWLPVARAIDRFEPSSPGVAAAGAQSSARDFAT